MFFLGYYYLWIAPHLLLAVVFVISLRRGVHRQLPIFYSYAAFELAQFLTLFTISRVSPFPNTTYRWALVLGMTISAFLILAVIFELANDLLASRSSLAGVLRPLLRWGTAALLLCAAIACAILPALGVQYLLNMFQVLDFTSSLLQTGLLLSLFLFSRALHIAWRSWTVGIAVGFGISASINLATAALRAEFGRTGLIAVDITQMAAFHACVVIWLVYLFLPERAPRFAGGGLEKSQMEFWDQELERMVRR